MKANKILQAVLLMILIAFAASSRSVKTNSVNQEVKDKNAKNIFVKNKALYY